MGLHYKNIGAQTRQLMISEIDLDVAAGSLYLSDNLSETGRSEYEQLLRDAVMGGSDDTLADQLQMRLNSHEKPRRLQSGGYSKPPVMRSNAHQMLAEGEFNRFYVRAICVRALQDGLDSVVVYRAKEVSRLRAESVDLIGKALPARRVLDDLRANPGTDAALGLPPGPNSGLSAELPLT